jgi:hypothetical protein
MSRAPSARRDCLAVRARPWIHALHDGEGTPRNWHLAAAGLHPSGGVSAGRTFPPPASPRHPWGTSGSDGWPSVCCLTSAYVKRHVILSEAKDLLPIERHEIPRCAPQQSEAHAAGLRSE